MTFSAFAFAVVKVSANTSLLGEPTLNELFTKALHIGLWNSIENDFVLIAACLPSVRPLFAACGVFTRTHLTASKPTRVTSSSESQYSLKGSEGREHHDDHASASQLTPSTKPSHPSHGSIQVRHEVSLQQEEAMPDEAGYPPYNFHIR
jgi:hypothetical protein